MRRELLVVLTLSLLISPVGAQGEDVIITANRTPVPANAVADDVEILTKEEIEKYGFTNIADVLKYVAGVQVYSTGGPGKQTGLFVLGLDAKYVLVMVNGVPVNDPSNPDGAPNLEWLDLNAIDRIEVLKGPQSALYGSEAAAAVVNIITKEPKSSYLKVLTEGGKYLSFKERMSGAAKFEEGYLSFSVENFKTNGFSATNEKAGQYTYNPDNDGFHYTSGYFSIGYRPTEDLKIRLDSKVKEGYTEYDEGRTNYDKFFTSFNLSYAQRDNVVWDFILGNNKETRRDTYSFYNGITRYAYLSPTIYIDEKGENFIKPGVSYRYEVAEAQSFPNADGRVYIRSIFLEGHFDFYDINLNAVYRIDDHKNFGSHSTYKVSASYTFLLTDTTFKWQYGTGFKAPTISQLYGFYSYSTPYYTYKLVGNSDLKPEKTEGWILGIEQRLKFVSLGLNYFKNHLWNVISTYYDAQLGVNTYQNVNKATTEGAELTLKANITDWLSIKGNYTHLSVHSQKDSFKWRKPEESYSLSFTVKRGKFAFDGEVLHYGRRKDYDFSAGREVSLSGFTVYNCYISCQLKKNFELYAKGVNLTDKDYELAYGYNTMGRALFVGAIYSFK